MGPEFSEAVPYLQIMALAQFLVAVTGPLAMLLNMSGRERASMWINIFSLATAIVLIPYLSILRGAQGFAAAYCVVIFGRVFFLAVFSQLPRIHSFRKT